MSVEVFGLNLQVNHISDKAVDLVSSRDRQVFGRLFQNEKCVKLRFGKFEDRAKRYVEV